jgi:hypothetical protein
MHCHYVGGCPHSQDTGAEIFRSEVLGCLRLTLKCTHEHVPCRGSVSGKMLAIGEFW